MRQDGSQQDQATAATAVDGGVGLSSNMGRMDGDFHSLRSAGSRVADAARRMATKGRRPKAILLQTSLTSVLFELVRSNPWETVVRAGISGLTASCSLNEEGVSEGDTTAVLSVAFAFFLLASSCMYFAEGGSVHLCYC